MTLGKVASLNGGYSRSRMDSEVLATRAGASYLPVAKLAVPVRYPAAAVLGRKIYVFGGETLHALAARSQSSRRRSAGPDVSRIVGAPPAPARRCGRCTRLGGAIYVAGGATGPAGTRPTAAVVRRSTWAPACAPPCGVAQGPRGERGRRRDRGSALARRRRNHRWPPDRRRSGGYPETRIRDRWAGPAQGLTVLMGTLGLLICRPRQ